MSLQQRKTRRNTDESVSAALSKMNSFEQQFSHQASLSAGSSQFRDRPSTPSRGHQSDAYSVSPPTSLRYASTSPVLSPNASFDRQPYVDSDASSLHSSVSSSSSPAQHFDARQQGSSVFEPIMHAVQLLQRSTDAQRAAHFQPATACVISSIRSALSATDCLAKESSVLKMFPVLAKERRQILSALAVLVAQARKASSIEDEQVDERHLEARILSELAEGVSEHVKRFMGALDQCGLLTETRTKGGSNEPTFSFQRPDSPPVTKSSKLHKARSLGDLSNARSRRQQASEPFPDHLTTRPELQSSHPQPGNASSGFPWSHQQQQQPITPSPTWHDVTRMNTSEITKAATLTHDSLLSTVAAFIGHVHAHSRSSHSSSHAHLIEIARETLEILRKIFVLVETVCQHRYTEEQAASPKLVALDKTREALYDATSSLVTEVQHATSPTNQAAPIGEDEEENQDLLHAATVVLRSENSCSEALQRCLRRKDTRHEMYQLVGRLSSPPPQTPGIAARGINSGEADFLLRPRLTQLKLQKTTARLPPLPDKASIAAKQADVPLAPSLLERRGVISPTPLILRDRSNSSVSSTSVASTYTNSSNPLPPIPDEGNANRGIDSNSPSMHPPSSAQSMSRQSSAQSFASTTPSSFSPASDRTGETSPRTSVIDSGSETKLTAEDVMSLAASRSYQPREISFNSDGQVVAGTIRSIIERMTLPDTTTDPIFASTFFLTFRMFSSPTEVTAGLLARFNMSPPANLPEDTEAFRLWRDTKLIPIRLRVFNILKTWLETHWHPTTDQVILDPLLDFTKNILSQTMSSAAARLGDLISRRSARDYNAPYAARAMMRTQSGGRSKMGKPAIDGVPLPSSPMVSSPTSHFSMPSTPPPNPSMTKNLLTSLRTIPFSQISILEFDPLELARQFTIMESRIYCSIQPSELLSLGKKKGNTGAANVRAMSSLSTRITGWISELILSEHDARRRTHILKYFVKLADVSPFD